MPRVQQTSAERVRRVSRVRRHCLEIQEGMIDNVMSDKRTSERRCLRSKRSFCQPQ